MFELFYQYLILHRKVGVPGFGFFVLERQPSQYHFDQKSFSAPTWRFNFVKENVTADKAFYQFICSLQNKDEATAMKEVSDFTADIRREMSVYKKVLWPRIGVLAETAAGQYELTSNNSAYAYFPDAHAEMVTRQEGEKSFFQENNTSVAESLAVGHEPVAGKKHDWWIDAIVMALLAMAAIVFYFVKNGTLR